ncbi:MAG: UDP-glucose/GDP-mannose dehydrogenase family protein [Gammaproteobacteria bacterium]|nr:UDP-glucose/GDP-mannose dehydrogenase family protein [Gammaproteobacteria bacterium]
MKVTIFGSGYVGLVTGVCLAEMGNHILFVDTDTQKIEMLNKGGIPIYEPGLEPLLRKNSNEGRLIFTTDAQLGVEYGLVQMIAVGTPPDEDGSADLQYVLGVASTIGQYMRDHRVIVTKSTVPVGTGDKVHDTVAKQLAQRHSSVAFDVVSNPEFLKEGAAIDDFMRPDRIIVGTESTRAIEILKTLYAPFNRNHDRILVMDRRSSELTKYAANAMLATKISFMNELANIAEKTGADIEKIRIGIGSDPRIGYHFIYPGAGYGGSCFPKDVSALAHLAQQVGYHPEILNSVEAVNQRQKHSLYNKLHAHYKGNLSGKTFALWGLAFKPNTDDMREAPSRVLIDQLWKEGAAIRAFDPKAMEETRRIYGERHDLVFCTSPEEAVMGADALVVMTEWNLFRSPDFELLKAKLNNPVIFDGRNIYNPSMLREMGFTYYSIGRKPVLQ